MALVVDPDKSRPRAPALARKRSCLVAPITCLLGTNSGRVDRSSAHARLRPREAEALAAPHNPVFVHMGERVPVEMPALASVWNHAPTTIDGFRLRVTLEITGSNCMSNGKVSRAATLLLRRVSDVRASFQRTVRLDGAAETDSPRRKCTERGCERPVAVGSSAGRAARRPSPERGERSRAVGAGGGVIFATEDCRATYESLLAKGVEFTQEPTERFYGTDCALRDPFGNPLRFTQPRTGQASRRPRRNCRRSPDECPPSYALRSQSDAGSAVKPCGRSAPASPTSARRPSIGPPEAPSTVLPSRSCQELPPTRAYPPCRARMLGHPIPLRPAAR